MALLETLLLNLSPAIAKTLLKVWLKNPTALDSADGLIDALKSVTADVLSRKATERQLQAIADNISVVLEKVITSKGHGLSLSRQELVANSVVGALSRITIDAQSLIAIDLAPAVLTQNIIDAGSKDFTLFNRDERDLYDTVAREVAQYIIDISSQFPNFSERIAADSLRRDTYLISISNRILEQVESIRRAGSAGSPESAEFEIDYRRAIARNFDRLELFGVDVSAASKRHSLSVAYVSLAVLRKTLDSNDQSGPMKVEKVLEQSDRWLIRGAPGAGKTTLLNWIAVNAANDTFPKSLRKWNKAVPFVVPLRRFEEDALPGPQDFLRFGATALASSVPKGWVEDVLRSGRAIVLVDGIDEVSEKRRREVQYWLRDLAGAYPGSSFLVTSRPHAVESDWLGSEGFEEAELLEMRQSEILTFIEHWHSAVGAELNDELEKAELPLFASNLKEAIAESRSLRNLASSPLLCALICALHRDRHRQLPKDRVELYEACCGLLLERRDAERNISLDDYPKLTYRQKRLLLQDLAYWMLRNGQVRIDQTFVDVHLQQRVDSLRELPDKVTGSDVRRLFVERSGMLRELTFSSIDFTHRTFLEFLAAHAAISESDIGALVSHTADDRWREPIIWAASIAGKRALSELMTGLNDKVRSSVGNPVPPLLLAAQCIDAALEVPAHIRAFVEKEMAKLKEPSTVAEVKMFAAAGELGLPYLRFAKSKSEAVLVASVRELMRLGTDEAMAVLESYASASASGRLPRVYDLLTEGWESSIDRDSFRDRVVKMEIASSNALADFTLLSHWTSLESVEATLRHKTSLLGLERLTALREIRISGFGFACDVGILGKCTSLSHLSLRGTADVSLLSDPADVLDLPSFPKFGRLETLEMSLFGEIRRPAVSWELERLAILGCTVLPPIGELAYLPRLRSLRLLAGQLSFSDLAELRHAECLEELELLGIELAELGQLATSPAEDGGVDDRASHEQSDLGSGSSYVEFVGRTHRYVKLDFSWVAELQELRSLTLDLYSRTTDFVWLKKLINLTTLTLKNLGTIENLDFLLPLQTMKNLKSIRLLNVPPTVLVPREVRKKVKEVTFLSQP